VSTPVPQPRLFAADAFPLEVLLIRHGQSAAVVPGSTESEDPPLSELGTQQAAKLANRLATKQLDGVYASPLQRAVETARPLADARGLEIGLKPELREVGLGEWEYGGFRQRAAAADPAFLAFAAEGRWDLIPGSEGDDGLRRRSVEAVTSLVDLHAGGSIAVVCHSGFINAFLAEVLGIHRSVWVTIENTSITLVRAGAGRRMVVTVNDCHHLYDPALVGSQAAG
jgi:probable phosphoglycerate mutase